MGAQAFNTREAEVGESSEFMVSLVNGGSSRLQRDTISHKEGWVWGQKNQCKAISQENTYKWEANTQKQAQHNQTEEFKEKPQIETTTGGYSSKNGYYENDKRYKSCLSCGERDHHDPVTPTLGIYPTKVKCAY